MADEAEGVGPREGVPRKQHALLAWLSLAAVFAAVVALLVLDLWVIRPPAQQAFITRNLECLRCHAELLPKLTQASVHQPFLTQHCTSCHTPHGYERTAVARRAALGPEWLRLRLEQIGLRFVWNVLSGLGALRESPVPDPAVTRGAGSRSVLTAAEQELCWTCHGDLAAERLRSFQHPPFADGHCTSCHDPHASDSRPLLRASASDVCVSCHRVGPELLATQVHAPFGQLKCVSCHEPHASSYGGMLVASQRDLCFGCHGTTAALLSEAVRHEPFANGACTGCHKPHSAGFLPLLAAPQPDLCYGCHGGVSDEFAQASSHPVPAQLICSDCHLPHAAPVSGLLPVAQRELCLGCHGSVQTELASAMVHKPVAVGDCTQCHLPHGSPAAPLLTATDPSLCRRCHTTVPAAPVRSPAPFRSQPRPRYLPSATVRGGKRPTGIPDPILDPGPSHARGTGETSHRVRRCAECHEAHASDNGHLTVAAGDALCLGCHRSDVPRFATSSHRGFSCSRCHTPHRAAGTKLLNAANPALCLGCHPGYTHPGNYHPVGARYYDYLARGPLTCTSTCHDPHGSAHKRMLRVGYGEGAYGTDYVCLLCHTSVGIGY